MSENPEVTIIETPNFVFGIDISVWQTNDAKNPRYLFDPKVAKSKGVKFAYIRASIGLLKDNALDKFAVSFNEAGIPIGFYHFLRGDVTYQRQADVFLAAIKPHKFQLPPALDVEASGLGLDMIRQWLGRVETKLGIKPIIYTAPNPWNTYIGVAQATWALEYEYWEANYIKGLSFPVYGIPEIVKSKTPIPLQPWAKAGKKHKYWQFCAAGHGEFYGGDYAKHTDETALDMNLYNGSEAQFIKEYGLDGSAPSEPETPNEEPTPSKFLRIVNTAALRGRATPVYLEGSSELIFKRGQILEKASAPVIHEAASEIDWQPVIIYVSKKYTEDT